MNTMPINRDAALRIRARSLTRAIAGWMYTEAKGGFLPDEVERLWKADKDLHMIARAAVTPTTTSSDSAQWSPSVVSDLINLLAPVSAGARALASGLKVNLDTTYGVIIPDVPSAAANVGWVGEGNPIPVGQLNLTESNTLVPHKMATIVVATRELFNHSIPTWESVIRASYTESFQLALDALVLSATAGDSTKSAGLLNGVAALTKSVLTDPMQAMLADVKTVVGAVATVANGNPIILVTDPVTAITLRAWKDRVPYDIYGSAGVEAGDLIAIATNGIASSVDEVPTFTKSKDGTVVMNTVAAPISATGTPNTVAAPIRSFFQTDSIGLKVELGASWLRRSDSAVAWLDDITAW